MKKDGIQTRNRKLSAKKKKKGMHPVYAPDMLRCDKNGGMSAAGFGSFASHNPYNMYNVYNSQHLAAILGGSNAGGLVAPSGAGQGSYPGAQHHPSMHGMSGLGLSGAAAAAGGGAMAIGGFCTVGA